MSTNKPSVFTAKDYARQAKYARSLLREPSQEAKAARKRINKKLRGEK